MIARKAANMAIKTAAVAVSFLVIARIRFCFDLLAMDFLA
jgi:hypothetical protein